MVTLASFYTELLPLFKSGMILYCTKTAREVSHAYLHLWESCYSTKRCKMQAYDDIFVNKH